MTSGMREGGWEARVPLVHEAIRRRMILRLILVDLRHYDAGSLVPHQRMALSWSISQRNCMASEGGAVRNGGSQGGGQEGEKVGWAGITWEFGLVETPHTEDL